MATWATCTRWCGWRRSIGATRSLPRDSRTTTGRRCWKRRATPRSSIASGRRLRRLTRDFREPERSDHDREHHGHCAQAEVQLPERGVLLTVDEREQVELVGQLGTEIVHAQVVPQRAILIAREIG